MRHAASEFQLEGEYLLGGLFDIHHDSSAVAQNRPKGIDCSSRPLILSSYRRFQLMRFSVEEINNSTSLLPNVSLGYDIFDHCSDAHNFPGILKLLSVDGMIQPWSKEPKSVSKVIALVGPYTSPQALAIAPLFMMDLIPMVSYGAASSIFSRKQKFPSFLRTVHSNKDVIEVIVHIMQHFNWRWVAFLYIDDDYGNDGRELFMKRINNTDICMAYTKGLNQYTDHSQIFRQIERQKIGIIIVFAPEWTAEALIESAMQLNVTNKVWIAGDAWSLNKKLRRKKGIKHIGTVIGVSEPKLTIPGFKDFIYSSKKPTHSKNARQNVFCSQVSNCSGLTPEEVLAVDPSFNVPVYSAVYAIAHALHNTLQCESGRCNGNITVYPHMVLAELKKSNFTLLNQSVAFDENGDPNYGSYSIVFWNQNGDAEEIGFYHFRPTIHFINNSQIQWYTEENVPTSLCSQECDVGFARNQIGIHKCCFNCHICEKGTYINKTEDPYRCISCQETEWSEPGSTSCALRLVEYVPFTDSAAMMIMVAAGVLVGLTLAMSALFAINFNTPVVRSAGGPMCFLIFSCLSLCSLSVFFYFVLGRKLSGLPRGSQWFTLVLARQHKPAARIHLAGRTVEPVPAAQLLNRSTLRITPEREHACNREPIPPPRSSGGLARRNETPPEALLR
ncbi:taste receptor type 1 member 1-like [Pseudoliparis swirei]|uniref:taste receptor type 1 member 1-like n=1 Tax=Pseudoliparis swirei TaxID=2059687 RepID=UPI0024BEA086|nr:taste receptor type 1 member 1-like [Pseudoliparis swirei]